MPPRPRSFTTRYRLPISSPSGRTPVMAPKDLESFAHSMKLGGVAIDGGGGGGMDVAPVVRITMAPSSGGGGALGVDPVGRSTIVWSAGGSGAGVTSGWPTIVRSPSRLCPHFTQAAAPSEFAAEQ